MNELVEIRHGDVYTNTYIIAQNIEREHKSVIFNINKYWTEFEKMGPIKSSGTRLNQRGQPAKAYDLNKAQAIFLMTLMDNTPIVLDFKVRLSLSFVKMERLLLEKKTEEWQQVRTQGKNVRLQETDAIKALMDYAKAQGSQHAERLYVVYSRLVKQLTEYDERDAADADTLLEILAFERLLSGIITSEMQSNTHYKAIYANAKRQLMEIRKLWAIKGLPA